MWRDGSQQQRDQSEENLLSLISSFPIGSDTPGDTNNGNHHNDIMNYDHSVDNEDEGVANNSNSFRMSGRSRHSSRSGINSIHSSSTSSSTLRMSEENLHYFKDDNEADSFSNNQSNGKKEFESVKKIRDVIFDEEVPISSSSSCASSSHSNNSGIEKINAFVKTMEEHNKSGSYLKGASVGSAASGKSLFSGASGTRIAAGSDGDEIRKHHSENADNLSNPFATARATTTASSIGATTLPSKHSPPVKISTNLASSEMDPPDLDDSFYIDEEHLKKIGLDHGKKSNFAKQISTHEIGDKNRTDIDDCDGFSRGIVDPNNKQVPTFRQCEQGEAIAKHDNSGDTIDTDDESVDYYTALSAKFNIERKTSSEVDNSDKKETVASSSLDILAKFSIFFHDDDCCNHPSQNNSSTTPISTKIRESRKFQQTMQLLDQYDQLDRMTWEERADPTKHASSQRHTNPSESHHQHHHEQNHEQLPDLSAVARESSKEKEAKRQRNELIFILHSFFTNFCSPPPSLESIRNILLMETKRVLFVTGNNKVALNDESNDLDNFNCNLPLPSLLPLPSSKEILKQPHHQQYLPKEAMINTHHEAAQSIISLLQFSPSKCFLKLPLEFQLSFIRILMRLLSNESDDEYDEECMFHCREDIERRLYNNYDADVPNEEGGPTETSIKKYDGNNGQGRQRCNSIDTSFSDRTHGNHDPNRRRCNSANSQTIGPSYQQSSSKLNGHQSSHRDQLNATKKALSFSQWKSKKSSPLYSTVRFRSHPMWNMSLASTPDQKENRTTRHQRWSFVASRALLDLDKENLLRTNDEFEGSGLEDEDEDVPISSDAVETLIRLFQATLIQCLKKKEQPSFVGQYLLLGPLARLLGLFCATGASVKSLRSLLVLMEGSSYTNTIAPLERQNYNCEGNKGSDSPVLHIARLHAIRALRYSAEYSAYSSSILDKVGPPTFFSFGYSESGLSSVCTHQKWPFKNDFGIACWFRAETFGISSGSSRNGENAVLFRARTDDGAWIEVAFDPCSSDPESTAAMLVVTAGDVHDPKVYKPPREIRLSGCVLTPQVWYHIAIRLTRPRVNRFSLSSFTIKDEITIFLNGKVMLKDHMRMPNLPEPNQGGGGRLIRSSVVAGSLLRNSVGAGGLGRGLGKTLSSRGSLFSKPPSSEGIESPLQVSFLLNFDGQAGTLYVFNDSVSDEAFQVLHRETAGPIEKLYHTSSFSFTSPWDGTKGKLTQLAKVVNSASLHTELEDVVLPNYPVLIGTHSRRLKVLFDLIEEDDIMASRIPAELSKSSFGSKLFMVWDPCRVSDGVIIDAHAGLNAKIGERVSRWTFESIKDTIGSLGGMQRLLPLFGTLSSLPVDPAANSTAYSAGKRHPSRQDPLASFFSRGIRGDYINMILPSLLFLFSSFIREHEVNARELYRCGGINLIEKLIYDHKKRAFETSNGEYYGLGSSSIIANSNVCALLNLWQSSQHNFGLEITIFSRLLFNIQLLLGGLADCPCVALHSALLPVLSELAKLNPDKVRDCVETRELFEFIHEYSGYSSKTDTTAIDDGTSNDLSPIERRKLCLDSRLTQIERGHIIDLTFGIITISLSQRCYTNNLYPLITFISYNVNLEWEELPERTKGNGEMKRDSRYKTSLKAVSVLLFLLQKNPSVPHLIESLNEIFENGNGVAAWMLCCIVNSNDDSIRALGIKSLTAYLHAVMSSNQTSPPDASIHSSSVQGTQKEGATAKLTMTMKYVGTGLGVISQSANALSNLITGRFNIKVIYKLLWHLLKCHREELGDASTAALMYLLVDDGSSASGSLKLSDVLVQKNNFLGGISLNTECLTSQYSNGPPTLARQSIRNTHGVSTVLRLLRFLSPDKKERWLFDFLALILASPNGVNMILACDDWQPCLFQLVAEVIEEINGDRDDSDNDKNAAKEEDAIVGASNYSSPIAVDTEPLSRPSVRTRYDLSLKLYSTLLGHCVRQGDEKAFDAVEMAASLQRVDANGSEVFSIILSHLFADLIEKGTVAHVEDTYDESESVNVRNRALKQSARLVTQSILSNGTEGLDMASAVRQWRCLRHLTAVGVAVVTSNGFGVAELFDYRNQDASAVDGITGGMYGIRLDNMVSGINAFEALAGAKLHSNTTGRKQRERYRYVCVVLASQILTLLDAFIFPDNLDSSKAASQLHGLALVRSTEPRLGKSQGPLLASLVRLSLILLAYLEPSSVRFLQACSRLRCFLHWTLEIIRESVALGGYSVAFHELNAPLDRLVLAIVLQCHRALSRCSVVLVEMESSPWDKYFSDSESRQKSHRRLFRAVLELREIVFAAYRGRNEVLRAALSLQAHEALARGLEEMSNPKFLLKSSKEASLRTFLKNDWMTGFHDVEAIGDMMISEQVANGQVYKNRTATIIGRQAITELVSENTAIVKEYSDLLGIPFNLYCENQRRWAETEAVREREFEGNEAVKKFAIKYRSDSVEGNKILMAKFSLAMKRMLWIVRTSNDPWNPFKRWLFPSITDTLYRRILFARNYYFNDHADACYDLTLGKERDKITQEETRRKEKEREMTEALLRVGDAIVPYDESALEDVEDDEPERTDDEILIRWKLENDGNSESDNDNNGEQKSTSKDAESVTLESKSICSEWDQFDDADFGESDSDPYAWAKKFMWSEGEHFVQSFESVVIVSLQSTMEGKLLLTTQNIYFHQTEDALDVFTKQPVKRDDESPRQDLKWKLSRLTDIHGRRYMLKAQGLELFFADMKGLFLKFGGMKERDVFFSKLTSNCKAPLLRPMKSLNPRTVFKKTKLTDLWRKRKISNFQYLMMLNLMAGRTFNDVTQYPVFPWVLCDYTSETLDLSDHRIYRDLSKPVGALNPDRLAQLIERYNDLDGFVSEEEKFLYGSHYSSPGVVLHYLVRQEPYTSMHIALQSGRFDCADRMFHDVAGCWDSCMTSTSDVKELTPEFFTCPEIFVNTNNFPLGQTQSKIPISNVKLPPWAKESPHEFIRIHRLALESEYVSNNLHHWIDLIFGYKQRGPAAAANHNVFHYLSYEGSVDLDKISDEVTRQATESHIQNFGQTPSQLIVKDPHPPRSRVEDDGPLLEKNLQALRCHTPAKQFGGPRNAEANGPVISLHALGEYIFAIHSDLSLCSYKIHPIRGVVPFTFKAEKTRHIISRKGSRSLSAVWHALNVEDNVPFEADSTSKKAVSGLGNSSFAISLGGSAKLSSSAVNSSDSSYLLLSCGYFDNCLKVQTLDSSSLRHNQNGGHRGQINCLQAGEDGTVMVTGGQDCTCRIWVIDHDSFASSLTDGYVYSSLGVESGLVRCCHVLLGHVSPITCVAMSTKLDVVISGSEDGSICIHNIRSGKFVRSLHVDASTKEVKHSCAINGISVRKLAIHVDGTFVANFSDENMYLFTVNGQKLADINLEEQLHSMIICQQSERLITGGEKGLAKVWTLHDLSLDCTVDVSTYGAITSLVLTPMDTPQTAQYLCVGSSNGSLSIVYKSLESSSFK